MSQKVDRERREIADENRLKRGEAVLAQLRRVLELYRATIQEAGFGRFRAMARQLGISPPTLYKRLHALGLARRRRQPVGHTRRQKGDATGVEHLTD